MNAGEGTDTPELYVYYNTSTNFENKKSDKQHFIWRDVSGWKMYVFSQNFIPTLLHLPPLRFHCDGGCWKKSSDFGIVCHTVKKGSRVFRLQPGCN
jgi:hypothetical protein